MFRRLRDAIEDIRWEDAADPSRWVKFVRGQVRLYFYILRELVRNRCPQQAAALTFTTLLSLVPLFAVAFSFFRGFAALEGVENRAQDVIFRSILAAPLLSQQVEGRAEQEADPEYLASVDALSAGELLAEANRQSRVGGAGLTLHLYVRALNAGADPSAVREGISVLHLAAIPLLPEAFGLMQGAARDAYLRAAGVEPGAVREERAPSEQGQRYFEQATHDMREQDWRAAVAALEQAEQAGYPPLEARRAAGDAFAALGGAPSRDGALDEAVASFREALLRYSDALVIGCRSGWSEQMAAIADDHASVRQELALALFELGKQGASRCAELLALADGEAAEEARQAALRNLHEAAGLVQHPSEVHALLGDVYSGAGRSDEALEHYRMALQRDREVAARGISLAVVDHIRNFVDKVGRAEIGIVGILVLLVTATSLLNTIERTLNHIWKVTERRPFWIKFTSFCTLIWLGPALIGTSIWVQERLGVYIEGYLGHLAILGPIIRLVTNVGEHILPLLMTWLVLVALYKFLPHTHVRFTSVAWGAFLGAILLQAARPLFTLYVFNAVRYQKIYGSLGAVPIFLLWIWLQWLIVLFGAEVAFTIQNVGLLRFHDRLHRLSSVFIDRYLAARVMMYVAREFYETGRPMTAARLADILQMTPEGARDAAGRLVKLGLLTPVGEQRDEFHPGRDLSQLKLSEVLSITDRFRAESRSARPEDRPYEDKLESVFRSSIEAQDIALQDMTLQTLLQRCEQDRDKYPNGPPQA